MAFAASPTLSLTRATALRSSAAISSPPAAPSLGRSALFGRPSVFSAASPPRAGDGRGMFGMFGAGSARAAVAKGDKAPDFSAKDQTGATVSLADFRGKSAVTLFFYPKDNTPGCTKQACAFRDAMDDFKELDSAILGVSAGSSAEHSDFDKKFSLNYPLLVDEGNKMRKAFGVPMTFGVLPGRVTYIIDKEGTVVEVFNSQLAVTEHVAVAKKALEALAK